MNKELTPLEALERLTKIHNYDVFKECYEVIEKSLKALEIIKAKGVYPQRVLMYKNNINFYNAEVSKDRQLTQEEFDLLKEVLK